MTISSICKRRLRLLLGLLACVACSIPWSSPRADAQEKPPPPKVKGAKQPRTIALTQRRTYNLDVARLDPLVDVTLAKQWVFAQTFPPALLRAIKKSPALKTPAPAALLPPEPKKKGKIDSGYLRWLPGKKDRQAPSALLWFVNGSKRKELVISISRSFDHTVAKGRAKGQHAFGPLRVAVDLDNAKMTEVRWADLKLPPAGSKSAGVEVEDTVLISVMGTLAESSRAAIRAADRLLSDEVTSRLSRLGYAALSNESHHGVSLGWLGQEHLRHELLFVVGPKAVDFRYRVSGTAFPMDLVRRQLHDNGWPLVLHGHEYLGASEEGVQVFQPVEFTLSKPKTAKKGKNRPRKKSRKE